MAFSLRKRVSSLCFVLLFLLTAVLILVRSDPIRTGVRLGLANCGSILIPSLFPFLVLSGVLAESKAMPALQRLAEPLTRLVFRLPGCTALPVIMGFVGGYPVGARLTAELLARGQIDRETAQRLLCFCVNSGPSFLVTAVGAGMLGNPSAGVLLLICQWPSAVIMGVLSGLSRRNQKASDPLKPFEGLPFPAALVKGVGSGITGMLSIIGYVLLFSAVGALLPQNSPEWTVFSGLLEVTNGCLAAAEEKDLLLLGFLTSFSSLSIVCQVMSFFPAGSISFRPFWISRPIHGVMTALLVKGGLVFFPQASPVFSSQTEPLRPVLSGTPALAVLLAVLCAVFLCSLPGSQRLE